MHATTHLSLDSASASHHQAAWYHMQQQQQMQPQQQTHQQLLLQQYVARQQRWILFMRHCCQCRDPEQTCLYSHNCTLGKALWDHILTCTNATCQYPRCARSRLLLKHHQKCEAVTCPVCVPVKDYLQQVRQQQQSTKSLLEPSAINDDIQALMGFPTEFDTLLRVPA